MERWNGEDLYRCDLCRGSVDNDTRERARHAWQPLIICERCVRDAEAPRRQLAFAASAA
jgi:hypothetical protein